MLSFLRNHPTGFYSPTLFYLLSCTHSAVAKKLSTHMTDIFNTTPWLGSLRLHSDQKSDQEPHSLRRKRETALVTITDRLVNVITERYEVIGSAGAEGGLTPGGVVGGSEQASWRRWCLN